MRPRVPISTPEAPGASGVGPGSAGRAAAEGAAGDELERLTRLVEEKEQQARASDVRARQAEEELERARERIRKDAMKESIQRKRGVLLDFLVVLDDLDRAVKAARRGDRDPALVEGVELVRKSFLARLGQHGVTHSPALGQRFDPTRHEAVSMVPVSDPAQDGMVVGVVREAYLIGDETLRPAAVAVGQVL